MPTQTQTLSAPAQQPADQPAVTPAIVPPVLGAVPTGINQILVTSLGEKASHFKGPVASGGVPGSNLAVGAALLSLAVQVDYSMGNFSLALQFPPDCVLLWTTTLVYTAFAGGTGDTTVALGTTANGVDVLAATAMGAIHTTAIHPVTGTLPYGADANPGKLWITVTQLGSTAGLGLVNLIYARNFLKWN
jgi:hypothetical protein